MTLLSKRLEAALVFTRHHRVMADIGTDHAYLPIEAIRRGLVREAIASDNKKAPYLRALAHVRDAHLEDHIAVVLADGLEHIRPEVDLVVIMGMGGTRIREILDKAILTHVKRLVLSPNSEAELVRGWLENHGYAIEDESFVEDNQKHYAIIAAGKGEMTLTDDERTYGPIILKKLPDAFRRYVEKTVATLSLAAQKAKSETTRKTLILRAEKLKGLIS